MNLPKVGMKGRRSNPRSYINISKSATRRGQYRGHAGFVNYTITGQSGDWRAHLEDRYINSVWDKERLAPMSFQASDFEYLSAQLARIAAACATRHEVSRHPTNHAAPRLGNPTASRFVLLDAGPSAGHHGADDRYTLICTAPQGSGSRAYYNYLGFGTGVSAHGEFSASEFRALKAERYRSLGKSIKIEALPASFHRLAERFMSECG